MKKNILVTALLLSLLIVIAGCGNKQSYTGYAGYAPQGNQPVPVAGGCGVIAPNEIGYPIEENTINSAL